MKSKYKDKLLQMIKDISNNDLASYDIKKLSTNQEMYRIKIGNIRCIYMREDGTNKIVTIETRGDVYKGLNK